MPAPSRQDFAYGRARLLLVAAVAVIAVAVWGVAQIQRNTASSVFADTVSGQRMLTGMLDQETGLRGFALTRREGFLDPFRRGVDDFERAAASARSGAHGQRQREQVHDQIAVARRWRGSRWPSCDALAAVRSTPGWRSGASASSIPSGGSTPPSSAAWSPAAIASSAAPAWCPWE